MAVGSAKPIAHDLKPAAGGTDKHAKMGPILRDELKYHWFRHSLRPIAFVPLLAREVDRSICNTSLSARRYGFPCASAHSSGAAPYPRLLLNLLIRNTSRSIRFCASVFFLRPVRQSKKQEHLFGTGHSALCAALCHLLLYKLLPCHALRVAFAMLLFY